MSHKLVSARSRLNIGSALSGASSALLMLSLMATPVQAADECGAAVAGVVTCDATGMGGLR